MIGIIHRLRCALLLLLSVGRGGWVLGIIHDGGFDVGRLSNVFRLPADWKQVYKCAIRWLRCDAIA